jgi:hypothetical protein
MHIFQCLERALQEHNNNKKMTNVHGVFDWLMIMSGLSDQTPKTNDKNRCNYLQYERVLKFSTFIFLILSNLAKYTYGQSPFEKHHKIGGRKHTHSLSLSLSLRGRGHLVYILSLMPYFLNK